LVTHNERRSHGTKEHRRKEAKMVAISASTQALLGSDAVAHVWTQNPDGSPQVSVVWVIAHGDEILFGTDAKSRKARNLALDPNVILSIEDTERNERGFQRHLVIRGKATTDPGSDPALMDRLAAKYVGLSRHPLALRDSPSSVVVRVAIDRISGVGPWIDETSMA
jgi:PPOX class probable F420-dependent enzyme